MVTHDRALTGHEGKRLCPAQANANAKQTDPSILIDAARIASYIQTGNTDVTGNPCNSNRITECSSWRLASVKTMATSFKPNAVNSSIYFWFAKDLCNHVRQW